MKVWDASARECCHTFKEHSDQVCQISPPSDTFSMTFCCECTIIMCRISRGQYYLYRTASLLRPAHCYARPPPPPYFREKSLFRVILPPLHAPPRTARAGLRYCSSCTCTRVASVESYFKRVENSLRTGLGLFR